METSPANNHSTKSEITTWLFNPFHYLAGGKALVIGTIILLATVILTYTGYLRLSGSMFYSAVGPRRYPLWVYFVEGLLPWIIISAFLFLCGKVVSRSRIRFIDVFGTQALARWPLLVVLLLMQWEPVRGLSLSLLAKLHGSTVPVFIVIASLALSLFSLLIGIWVIVLMYRAFSLSCNIHGSKAIAVFIGSLLATEFIFKLVRFYLFI